MNRSSKESAGKRELRVGATQSMVILNSPGSGTMEPSIGLGVHCNG